MWFEGWHANGFSKVGLEIAIKNAGSSKENVT
jgi:hypothetical protein